MPSKISLAKVQRSVFDLSHTKKFSAELGLLYPVCCIPVIPGDAITIGYEATFRASPMVSPVLHRVDAFYHAFYAPERILAESASGSMTTEQDYINFITGGEDGTDTTTLPTWNPSATTKRDAGTLWDMLFGFQGVTPDADSLPVDFPRRMYMETFNQYYRDVNVEPEIDWTQAVGTNQDMDGNALPTGYNDDESLQPTSWTKDYFTSARTAQQLGSPTTLSLGSATWDADDIDNGTWTSGVNITVESQNNTTPQVAVNSANAEDNLEDFLDSNTIASVDISELRLAFQIQKWQELAMRAGVRYPEWSKAFFGVNVGDARISRVEYIGGAKQPVIHSEIARTYDADADSGNDPVGSLAGKGTSMNGNFLGKFRAPEFGWLMVLMSIVPKPAYHQGIRRYFTRRDRYDYYNPLFAHLSEQAILRRELYVTTVKADNETVFGYIPIWDEHRIEMDTVHGLLAPGQAYDYWHMGRNFGGAPTLSASFIRAYQINDDAWAVAAQPHYFVNHANLIKAVRPMPFISTPGNVDR